jgi:Fur family transcriptional regulator, peroxide stress response regulator
MSRTPNKARPSSRTLRRELNRAGRRATGQREIVYAYLSTVRHHPTADDVHRAVRRQIPRVSLATIYNALEAFVRSGLASKLTYGDGAARYDVRTDPHSHARCLGCGRVIDVDAVPTAAWVRRLRPRGFTPVGFRFEVLGHCRACRPR